MRLAGMAAAAVAAGASGAAAQEPSLLLDEITIMSAARDARPLLETPVAATVLEGEALEVRQATNFQELIGDAPGATILGGPRGISQEPNIRGFTDDQIVLRFDGERTNFNDAHRGRFFIDPEIIQGRRRSPCRGRSAGGASPRGGRRTATSARRRRPSMAAIAVSTPSDFSAGSPWAGTSRTATAIPSAPRTSIS
jgi:hemoglobin/transferrin/lactoferrin receptor protein